jgi:type VI secretion system secreted protein Hcp
MRLRLVVLAALLMFVVPVQAEEKSPATMTLDIEGLGVVEISSFSVGVDQVVGAPGGGGGAGKAVNRDFVFRKRIDKASPVLLKACANGQHFKKAVLTVRKAGKGQQEYLVVTMEDVLISSYSVRGEGDLPADEVSVKAAEISYEILIGL